MSVLTGLLLDNFTTICLTVGLGVIALMNRDLDQRTNRSFLAYILIVCVLIASDITERCCAGLPAPTELRYLASAAGYTLRTAAVALLIGILMRRDRRTGAVFLWAPVAALALLAFTSRSTHLMFWFGEQNQFMRGPLGYASHVLSGAYLLLLVALTLKIHRYITAAEIFAVLFSAGICVAATVLESLLSDRKFLLTGAMITACALYYVVLYVETYRRDALTGLMNRRSFYLDAARLRGKAAAVVSIDLNGLKELNDSKGHSAGDRALQTLANAMRSRDGKGFSPYRVGGDEFMALGKGQTDAAVTAYMEAMRAALRAEGLMASFGHADYHPGESFDSVCEQADARMYDDKKRYRHRQEGRDGPEQAAPDGD